MIKAFRINSIVNDSIDEIPLKMLKVKIVLKYL
jgi:hypothetical protein